MAPIRYFVVVMRKGDEVTRFGALSAQGCLATIDPMRRDGWIVESIQRGTSIISLEDVEDAALVEAAILRSAPKTPSTSG